MKTKPVIAVLLSGSGVYDGAEIQEAVFTLLALEKHGAQAVCIAPDVWQHHVINHLTGEEMPEKRHVLVESARIARGKVRPLHEVSTLEFDALMIPGGFGNAKNLTKWAFEGADGEIVPEVRDFIQAIHQAQKPIAAICMAPAVLAKALQGTGTHAKLTVGTTLAPSPYDIAGINAGLAKAGAEPVERAIDELSFDAENKIITAPCYMMEASISEVYSSIDNVVNTLLQMLGH